MEFAIRDLTHAGKTRDIRAATSDFITLMNENHVRSTLLSHWPHLGTGLIPQKKKTKKRGEKYKRARFYYLSHGRQPLVILLTLYLLRADVVLHILD